MGSYALDHNIRVGDRIRVVTEGTVTDIGSNGDGEFIEYENGSEPACVYPNDGEFVSLEILRPEVKPGQVWKSGDVLLFVTTQGGEPKFLFSDSGRRGCSLYHFSSKYPDAKLVFDPDNA